MLGLHGTERHPRPVAPLPPPNGGTNGFAIASFTFALIGGLPLSFVFGFIAMYQVDRRGQTGRGFAIAGLLLSIGWFMIIAVATAAILHGQATRDETGAIVEAGTLGIGDIAVGDCVNGLDDDGTFVTFDAVPCDEPHQAELVDYVNMDDRPWDEQEVVEGAEESCLQRFDHLVGMAPGFEEFEVLMVYPTREAWEAGDREVLCMIEGPDGPTTGSMIEVIDG